MTSPVLPEINNQARHWHRAMEMLGLGEELNGSYRKYLREAEETEERLERLWLKRRKELAQPDAKRFEDYDGPERHESVFESYTHIPPMC